MYDDRAYFKHLYEKSAGEFSFHKLHVPEISSWQENFRSRLKQILGLSLIESMFSGYHPEAYMVNREEKSGYIQERWVIMVEPLVPLPFYLLQPVGLTGKLPLVLTPHGHNQPGLYVCDFIDEHEKQLVLEGDRDIAIQAVQQGYLVIAPTTRGFGDTRTIEDRKAGKLSSCRDLLVQDLLVGRTPIGDRVYDIARLIDWAVENREVDERCIAITGNSGGGTTSLFAAACDTRIQVAVPASYFCTFAGSIGSIFHCECNYVPGILGLGEMYDIAGLIAPRPFCAISGKLDEIFPINETQFAYQRLKELYDAAGVPDNCELFIGDGGHRYYKDGAWKFINKHFSLLRE